MKNCSPSPKPTFWIQIPKLPSLQRGGLVTCVLLLHCPAKRRASPFLQTRGSVGPPETHLHDRPTSLFLSAAFPHVRM